MKKFFMFNNNTKKIIEMSDFIGAYVSYPTIYLQFENKKEITIGYENNEILSKDYNRLIRFLHKKESKDE